MSDQTKEATEATETNEISKRLSSAMTDKMVYAIKSMDIEMDYIEIDGLSKPVTDILCKSFQSEDVQKAVELKMIETITAINPKKAAESLERTWGELLGEFLHKIVATFKPKKK